MRRNQIQQLSLADSLPSFSGKENLNLIFYFIEQLEKLCNLVQWDNARKFVVLKLNCKYQVINF